MITFRGRGKQSGVEVHIEVHMESFQLWTFGDDKAIRGRGSLDCKEALEAAGLR